MSTPPNYEQLYAQAMQALNQHEPYYFGQEETKIIMEENRKFNLKTAPELYFQEYFMPARDEKEGEWMTAAAILSYLKDKVGVSLLKAPSTSVFGRRLSAFPGLKKRETNTNTLYFVKKKR